MADATLDDDDEKRPDAPENEAGGEGGDTEEEEGGGFGAKKIVLFVIAPLLLLGVIGGGLYFTGTLDKLLGKGEAQEEVAEGKEDKKTAELSSAYFLEIPNMRVNLSAEGGSPRFLLLSVQLELTSEADRAAVETVMPRVVDQFQTYLRELRVQDLRGSSGIYRLQVELLSRVNEAAYPVEVKDVLFQEILIQ